MQNVMIDIETLGVKPGAAILSVAAVPFDRHGPAKESFYVQITLESSLRWGFQVEADTLLWWMAQSETARTEAFAGKHDVTGALPLLSVYLKQYPDAYLWANSPNFDLVLLEAAYHQIGHAVPWNFRMFRDVRTAFAVRKLLDYPQAGPNDHHPYYDCLRQIEAIRSVL